MELVTAARIICLGEGMVEERVAADGTLTTYYGGDTLNIAIHLARLGCDVAYATAVGCDKESDALLAAWQAEGIDTSLIGRHPARTVGDAFNAGYIAARLRGREPGDAALDAHRLAGWNIMRRGAISPSDDAAPYRSIVEQSQERAK